MSCTHQETSACDISLIEAADVQPLAGESSSVDTSTSHACRALRLQEAVHGLALRLPEFSASSGLWRWQATVLPSLAIVVCAGVLLAAEPTFVADLRGCLIYPSEADMTK